MLVADEPTGDLDAKSAEEILDLLDRLNTEFQKTIVMVTHDPRAAARAHRLVHLDKGSLSEAPAEALAALPARVPAVPARSPSPGCPVLRSSSGSCARSWRRCRNTPTPGAPSPHAAEPPSSPVPAFDGLSPNGHRRAH